MENKPEQSLPRYLLRFADNRESEYDRARIPELLEQEEITPATPAKPLPDGAWTELRLIPEFVAEIAVVAARKKKNLQNLEDLAKSYINTKKLVGHKTIGLPDENSDEKAWNEFYNKIGRPEKADGYELKRAEGLPAELQNADGLKSMLSVAHQNGVTQKQMQAILGEYDRQMLELSTAQQAQMQVAAQQPVKQLQQMWGQDFHQNLERAESTLQILDPDGKIDRAGLKGNVSAILLLNQVASRVMGDKLPQTGGSQGGVNELTDQIGKLMENPAFSNPLAADHERIMTQYKILQQQKFSLTQKKY